MLRASIPTSPSPAFGLYRLPYSSAELSVPFASLMSVRLREGFTIHGVSIEKADGAGEQQQTISVDLLLPWKANVLLESRLRSAWPAASRSGDDADARTSSELALVADYELLRDLEKQACERSPYGLRLALCKRLASALQVCYLHLKYSICEFLLLLLVSTGILITLISRCDQDMLRTDEMLAHIHR